MAQAAVEVIEEFSLFLVGFLLEQVFAVLQQRFPGVARVTWVLYAPVKLAESA
jgi:hypothetical protein